MVETGSGRIAMTGEVAREELYCITSLQGVLQDNEEVELVDETEQTEEKIDDAFLAHSVPGSTSDKTYANSLRNEEEEKEEEEVEFTALEHLCV